MKNSDSIDIQKSDEMEVKDIETINNNKGEIDTFFDLLNNKSDLIDPYLYNNLELLKQIITALEDEEVFDIFKRIFAIETSFEERLTTEINLRRNKAKILRFIYLLEMTEERSVKNYKESLLRLIFCLKKELKSVGLFESSREIKIKSIKKEIAEYEAEYDRYLESIKEMNKEKQNLLQYFESIGLGWLDEKPDYPNDDEIYDHYRVIRPLFAQAEKVKNYLVNNIDKNKEFSLALILEEETTDHEIDRIYDNIAVLFQEIDPDIKELFLQNKELFAVLFKHLNNMDLDTRESVKQVIELLISLKHNIALSAELMESIKNVKNIQEIITSLEDIIINYQDEISKTSNINIKNKLFSLN